MLLTLRDGAFQEGFLALGSLDTWVLQESALRTGNVLGLTMGRIKQQTLRNVFVDSMEVWVFFPSTSDTKYSEHGSICRHLYGYRTKIRDA